MLICHIMALSVTFLIQYTMKDDEKATLFLLRFWHTRQSIDSKDFSNCMSVPFINSILISSILFW